MLVDIFAMRGTAIGLWTTLLAAMLCPQSFVPLRAASADAAYGNDVLPILRNGYKHHHNNLPIIVAGRGGGSLKPGVHLVAPDPTPMCNLNLSLLHRLGVKADRFGDSDGGLKGFG